MMSSFSGDPPPRYIDTAELRGIVHRRVLDLQHLTRQHRDSANDEWERYYGRCVLPNLCSGRNPCVITRNSEDQALQVAFENIARLLPYMEVLKNVTLHTDEYNAAILTEEWTRLTGYLHTYLRNRGFSCNIHSCARTAQVNMNKLRTHNDANRRHFRFALMSEALTSLGALRELI